jgi:hypothetical protein
MSDWNRTGRDDDERHFGGEQQRQRGDERRWTDERGFGGERRSFSGRSPSFQAERDWDRDDWRREREQDPRTGDHKTATTEYPQPDVGPQVYGGPDYSGRGRRGQGAGGQAFGGQTYGGPDYSRGGWQGSQAYRQEDPRQRYGGQDDERRRNEQQQRRRGQGIGGQNEPLQRVTDGEDDGGFFGAFGQGEHRGRGPKNYTRSDERIRDDVNDRLSDDSWLDASEIEVQVSNCEVTLTGTVNSRDDKRRAEDVVEHVSGVKHVQTNLRVQPQAGTANRT